MSTHIHCLIEEHHANGEILRHSQIISHVNFFEAIGLLVCRTETCTVDTKLYAEDQLWGCTIAVDYAEQKEGEPHHIDTHLNECVDPACGRTFEKSALSQGVVA